MLLAPALGRRLAGPAAAVTAAVCLTLAVPTAASAGTTGHGAVVVSERDAHVSAVICDNLAVEATVDYRSVTTPTGVNVTLHRVTYTAANGASVTVASTQGTQNRFRDNGDGTGTTTTAFLGSERVRVPGEGVVLLDAGRVLVTVVTDLATGDTISRAVTIDGPHPNLESGGAASCAVITAALT